MGANSDRIERERDYWDHEIPTVAEVVAEFEKGPAPNVALMLDVARPAPGRRIIDFACGGGVTSLWLAQRGAEVTGIDLSPVSIDTAREAARRVGLDVTFEVADLEQYEFGDAYDALIGKYALHHLDVAAIAPAMANCLKPGATASFVETMATNPLLRVARRRLTGKYGIPRYGTLDEHPLVPADVTALAAAFGECRLETRSTSSSASSIDRSCGSGGPACPGSSAPWTTDSLACPGSRTGATTRCSSRPGCGSRHDSKGASDHSRLSVP